MNEYLSSVALCACVVNGANNARDLLWFVQPGEWREREALDGDEPEIWSELISRLYGALEAAQEACRGLLKLPVSFVMSDDACSWPTAAAQYRNLKLMLGKSFGLDQELLMRESDFSIADKGAGRDKRATDGELAAGHLENLGNDLESGQRERFFGHYRQMMDDFAGQRGSGLLACYYSVSLFFASYLNRFGLFQEFAWRMDADKLARYDAHATWKEVTEYFAQIAQLLLDYKENNREDRKERLIAFIERYIREHLEEDLTLSRLAALVNHSPSYLSRLYKRETGEMLFDYVIDQRMKKAKELLTGTDMKIYEIATAIGYEAAPYFTRTFKKIFGVTPQQFREMATVPDPDGRP